jgi:hypothetical protein
VHVLRLSRPASLPVSRVRASDADGNTSSACSARLYVLLGTLLPAAGVVVTLVILRRLLARMGILSILPSRPTAQAAPPGHARPPA